MKKLKAFLLAYIFSLPVSHRPSHYADTEAVAALAAARLEVWNKYWSLRKNQREFHVKK